MIRWALSDSRAFQAGIVESDDPRSGRKGRNVNAPFPHFSPALRDALPNAPTIVSQPRIGYAARSLVQKKLWSLAAFFSRAALLLHMHCTCHRARESPSTEEIIPMPYQLPPLSYPNNALEPHIDARTMEIHHDKHHQAYVNNVNKAIEGTRLGQQADRGAVSPDLDNGAREHPHGGPQQRRRSRQPLAVLDHRWGPARAASRRGESGRRDRERLRRLRQVQGQASVRPPRPASAAAGPG